MSLVYTSTIFHTVKKTLDKIIDDKTDDVESGALVKKMFEMRSMTDFYEDDLEAGGPGLAAEKTEGADMQTGTIVEGYLTRYISRTFALRMAITEEALEDSKYPKIIQFGKRLKRAMWKTIDYDATNVFVRAFDTNYPGGDGLPLFSASHTLPHGGTWSNIQGTPAAPSVASLIDANTQAMTFPGHDGTTEGAQLVKVVCPPEQWATWSQLINSVYTPTANNFAEINVVNHDLALKIVVNKYWRNTSTHYAILTDAEDKLNFRFKRKPMSRTWVENSQMVAWHAISARWSRGWSDPRAAWGSNP